MTMMKKRKIKTVTLKALAENEGLSEKMMLRDLIRMYLDVNESTRAELIENEDYWDEIEKVKQNV